MLCSGNRAFVFYFLIHVKKKKKGLEKKSFDWMHLMDDWMQRIQMKLLCDVFFNV